MRLAHTVVGDTGPHCHAETDELEHAVRAFPLPEVGELVATDDEHRVAWLSRLEGVDGTAVAIELDLDTEDTFECQSRELQARARRCDRLLVSRVGDDEDEQPFEIELVDRGARKRHMADMRGIEGAAENSEGVCHDVRPSRGGCVTS